jgi:hypothetical protein
VLRVLLGDEALCSSAERRDYEAHLTFRQHPFLSIIVSDAPNCLILLTNFAGRRTIANPRVGWQGHFAAFAQHWTSSSVVVKLQIHVDFEFCRA